MKQNKKNYAEIYIYIINIIYIHTCYKESQNRDGQFLILIHLINHTDKNKVCQAINIVIINYKHL